MPPELQDELADGLADARLERLEGEHMAPLEAPARVAALLDDFLGG